MESHGRGHGTVLRHRGQSLGNFANGIGQALAILALDRTARRPRRPPPSTTCWISSALTAASACTSSAPRWTSVHRWSRSTPTRARIRRRVTLTPPAFALMALRAVPSTPEVAAAIDGAVGSSARPAAALGGFLGDRGQSTRTPPGWRPTALRAAGEEEAAERRRRVHRRSAGPPPAPTSGASRTTRRPSTPGIAADRGQWTRATASSVLGLGLPDYGGIGSVAPEPAGLADISLRRRAPPTVDSEGAGHRWRATVTAGGSVDPEWGGLRAG